MIEKVLEIWNKYFELKKKKKDFLETIYRMQDIIIARLRKTPLPIKNLSINNPLKENILALFISTYSRTPLFICGRPGSSKTLSVNWFLNSFSTKVDHKNNPLFGFKQLK